MCYEVPDDARVGGLALRRGLREKSSDHFATGRVVFRATELVRHRLGGHSSTRDTLSRSLANRGARPSWASRFRFALRPGWDVSE